MLIIITSDGYSREDGNVFYSHYILVSSDTLKFDEPIFDDHPILKDRSQGFDERREFVVKELRNLGYTVEEPDTSYILIKN